MDIGVVTLFPEMFAVLEAGGVTARALAKGLLSVHTWNPRDHAVNRHRTVDDRPYGGGPGMVLQVEPVVGAIRAARQALPDARVVHLTPQGPTLRQAQVRTLSLIHI